MAWYKAELSSKMSDGFKAKVFVEAQNEDEARVRVASCSRYNSYDASTASFIHVTDSWEIIQEKIMDVTNPNAAINAQGDVLMRNREAGEIRKIHD